jgi:hypothetical protein
LLQQGEGLELFFLLWQQAKEENISHVDIYIYIYIYIQKLQCFKKKMKFKNFFFTIVTTTRRETNEKGENSSLTPPKKKNLKKKNSHVHAIHTS